MITVSTPEPGDVSGDAADLAGFERLRVEVGPFAILAIPRVYDGLAIGREIRLILPPGEARNRLDLGLNLGLPDTIAHRRDQHHAEEQSGGDGD